MSRVNSVFVIHTVRIPSGSLAVREARDLDAVACGQSSAEHVLAGVTGILSELVAACSSPTVHSTYEEITVAIGRLRIGTGL